VRRRAARDGVVVVATHLLGDPRLHRRLLRFLTSAASATFPAASAPWQCVAGGDEVLGRDVGELMSIGMSASHVRQTARVPYEVRAHNTATQSDNKIHDDEVARRFGFTGGLVPGVDVYAYLTHLPAEAWGLEWLERGTMRGRFLSPVYEGEIVTVVMTDHASAMAGRSCSSHSATRPAMCVRR